MASTTTLALAVALALVLQLAPPPATGAELFTAADLESEDSMWALYERWGARYGVAREGDEKLRRFAIFKETARRVYAAHPGNNHYVLGLNVFADMADEEFRDAYACNMPGDDGGQRNVKTAAGAKGPSGHVNTAAGLPDAKGPSGHVNTAGGAAAAAERAPHTPEVPAAKGPSGQQVGPEKEALPDSVDWRTADCKGNPCLTRVKHQGHCGCCWAMSAAGALESLFAIQGYDGFGNDGLVDLSVQQLVDCDTGNLGCLGGFASNAYDYIVQNGGLATEASYPYMGWQQSTCQAAAYSPVVSLGGFNRIAPFYEYDLMFAVQSQPVVVAVDGSDDSFKHYPGGIYQGPCGHSLNHELILVGYGTEGDMDFWILKNSWGEGWGEDGYMRLQRNIERDTEATIGLCGILMDAIYPYMEPTQLPP